jgi:hypothetical protein
VLMYAGGGALIAWYSGGVIQYLGDQGTTYANHNIVDSGGAASEFVNFNPARLTYNLMLKSVAQARSAGTTNGAPALDILGAARAASSTTAGAYGFPY